MILAFVDCETTHLSARVGEVWEVAVILRDHNGAETEYLWQLRPLHLAAADPEALRVGRYHERFVVPDGAEAAFISHSGVPMPMRREHAVYDITAALKGAVIVGSNPGFDDRHLRQLLDVREEQPWHYRPVDIATLAAGFMYAQEPELMSKDPKPFSSRWLSRQVGVEPPAQGVAHTALGDARWARDVHAAITRGPRRTGAVSA